MFARTRRLASVVIACLLLVVGLWAVVLTQSRGGQLVLGTVVVGVLVRRFGWRSAVLGAAVTLPIVLLSWRADADAESSSLERAEILSEGLQLLKAHPILGIGVGQFAGENPLNMAAHNSYLLIATEAGMPGYLLWCGLVWMTLKIALSVALRPPPGLDPGLVHFGEALAASTVGLHVGIFFLSFVYKHVFFVWLGLAGALFGAVRESHPEFTVRTTGRDVAGICALAVIALVAVRLVSMTAR
jgi:O-antigen ligase